MRKKMGTRHSREGGRDVGEGWDRHAELGAQGAEA